ncbi:hypothetical protein KIH74_03180 [Kineosporia sp. J2-2]|uniref:Secreted protein n=1 Tax=Kineosporia corallincola TaxID=2835133 RepID=A0ABS5TBX9_9ACTN|nr:hypothetical protein [Kineosporia corallincola]MBT0767909.1 hypothetical protein [Kineosporia corallincola]
MTRTVVAPIRVVVPAVIGTVLLVLGSRWLIGDSLVLFPQVRQTSCQDGLCVERVRYPDLLLVPGRSEVQVRHEGENDGRRYVQGDPFDAAPEEVIVTWSDGGVSLAGPSATLTWDADVLARLDD